MCLGKILGTDALKATIDNQNIKIAGYERELSEDLIIIEGLKKAILKPNGQIPVTDPLETYWNTKRPATNNYLYPARLVVDGSYNALVDVRVFYTPEDSTIPKLAGGNNHDDLAMICLDYVINNIRYISDITLFKTAEQWLFAFETLNLGGGDCEDGAILLANIMLKSGVPYWRLRLNAGSVQGGGHAWVTYLRESDNTWYILDWCYWSSESRKWLKWKDAEKYFDIWFSFSRDNIYAADMLDRA
jgi:predicted transglutaminase-like cysteine proteinase